MIDVDKPLSKFEYIRECVRERKAITKKDWHVKAFAIPLPKNEDPSTLENLDLCIRTDGLYVVVKNSPEGMIKLSDHKPDQPLFLPLDPITIDSSVYPNIADPKGIDTVIGRLLITAIVVPKSLETRIPFFNTPKMSVRKDIEKEIVRRVRNADEEQSKDSITVKEMVLMLSNIAFFESIATIINTASTPKSITRATGIEEFRKGLFEKYDGQLGDPVKLVEMETELRNYDKEYLKDDPVATNVFVGKTEIGRFKMYGMVGKALDFQKGSGYDTIIEQSVSDGMNTAPEELSKYFNDLRFASFSRGGNTALAGYIYKILQRSLSGLTISPIPCSTSNGVVRVLDKKMSPYMVGRYVKSGTQWKLLKTIDEVESLLGKSIEIRSPMFCKTEGDSICYACSSYRYKELPNGVTNIASDISATLLTMFLKLMHGTKTSITSIERSDLIN